MLSSFFGRSSTQDSYVILLTFNVYGWYYDYIFSFTLFGCEFGPKGNALDVDDDGDGFTEFEGDCDDEPSMFPGAAENDSETDCLTDEDEDGWSAEISDCDDFDASTVGMIWTVMEY